MKTAIFGGGCFWCTEAVFQQLRGVGKVESGYAGGSTSSTSSEQAGSPQAAPTYEQVSSGTTGHAEVIRVTYDPAVISYEDLLTVFFGSHDPTTPNRQGNDVGEQYRSVIFYQDESEKVVVEKVIKEINESLKDGSTSFDQAQDKPLITSGTCVVTQVVPLGTFYKAEGYHQNYYNQNKSAPYCQVVIESKIEKVRARFAKLLKEQSK